jgi:Fe2+ transport system protein FeoA
VKCPLCGLEFEKEVAENLCAAKCPIWHDCDMVRCPNCYYESVAEPEWYAKLFPKAGKERQDKRAVQPLSDWPSGVPAVVTRLLTDDRDALQKILAMGVLPQTRLKLIAKFPSFVFEIDERRFLIDEELAKRIYVEGE